jgi:two-component system sensor histidine kinase KdpD
MRAYPEQVNAPRNRRWLARQTVAALVSLGAVALVSVAIFLLEPAAPVVSLGVLYLFAVLPVAIVLGLPFAIAVSIVSMLAFNWLFLPPTHTLALRDSENWVALTVYLVTAVSVSGLAARARRRAAEADQRRREATLAAQISASLLESRDVEPLLPELAARTAWLLGAAGGRIELGSTSSGPEEAWTHELRAGDRVLGQLYLDAGAEPDPETANRVCSMVASLLATAIDRERLAREARESEARRQREAIEAESLRRSDAAKTAVLRSVSHDLRSPITAIVAASELLAGPGSALSDDDRAELVASIGLQADRLHRLVSNLLELSRLEAGAAEPELELWTIDGLIARALEVVGARNELVDVSFPDDLPLVRVDPTQIERALANLLENALKASPAGSRVAVEASAVASEVLVRVTDDGPGIPVHEHERIFDPFVRGASEAGEHGSGLGLAIARGFAVLNGGRVWVESAPGVGATFSLALPAVAEPAKLPA